MERLTEWAARQYNAGSLAFYGDSVYETLTRRYLLSRGDIQPARLHEEKVRLVCATFQAVGYERVLPLLGKQERAVLLRGRNAHVTVPQHVSPADYHRATGLEALFGYLALQGAWERLEELFQTVIKGAVCPGFSDKAKPD